jgi:hypothetical protein
MVEYSLDDSLKPKNKIALKEVPYSILKVDDESFIVGEERGVI